MLYAEQLGASINDSPRERKSEGTSIAPQPEISGVILAALVNQREIHVSTAANPGQDIFRGGMLVNVGMSRPARQ